MYHDDERAWETEGEEAWESETSGWAPDDSEGWRGDVHLNDWPENLAGPEYWLFKQDHDDE